MRCFLNHEETAVDVPPTGVVVVTGNNGSGKSAIVEACAWGVWGKTIRGTSPVPDGGDKKICTTITTDTHTVTREGKKGVVSWGGEYETNTKAQRALEAEIGGFDLWRRTHYYASESAGFGAATDAERKRLLERLLGIEHYAGAYRLCRDDLNEAKHALTRADHAVALAERDLDSLCERLEDAEAALEVAPVSDTPPTSPLPEGVDAVIVRRHHNALCQDSAVAGQTIAACRVRLTVAERSQAQMEAGTCPTCGQAVETSQAVDTGPPIEDLRRALADAEREYERLQGELKKSQAHKELADRHKAAMAAWSAQRERHDRAWRHAQEQITRLEGMLGKAEDALYNATQDRDAARQRLAVLTATATALGTKGFRAQVLGEALAGLEHATNAVLDHMTGGSLRIALRSYSETAKGKIKEAISLQVKGAGGGHGYAACSTGQRRRIDVAIVLALAGLAGARGTLWFDEVFDGLDAQGVERLAELLEDLATERAVIVITHSHAFADRISSSQRLIVSDGHVSRGSALR